MDRRPAIPPATADVRTGIVTCHVRRSAVLAMAVWLSALGLSRAAAPVLEHLYPAGASPGTSNLVQLSGKFDPWPVQTWVSGTGVRFLCETNRGQVRVEVASDAVPGPRLVRVFNAEGGGEPRFFVVGEGIEARDTEPNDRFSAPQVLEPMPAVVNGRLDKNGDADSYAIRLAQGEWLDARLVAFQLMSKVDAVLRLVDARGQQLAWNHDHHAFDPALRWRSPTEQTVVLQVFGFKYPADASIQLTGGEGCVYRLHLARTREAVDSCWSGEGEVEPNDTAPEATLSLPVKRVGAIGMPGDVDRYALTLEAGVFLEAAVAAAAHGAPLDAWLAVEDAAGKERLRVDDGAGGRDPVLSWKVPESGRYVVAVGSLTRQGGAAFRYRLSLGLGEPRVEANLAASTLVLGAGTTNELKVTWKRLGGHTNAAVVALRELPAGVSAAEVSAPAGDGDVTLKLVAATNAPASSTLVTAVIRETAGAPGGEADRPIPVLLISRGENNGVPQGWGRLVIDRSDGVWLTVTNPPAATNATASAP